MDNKMNKTILAGFLMAFLSILSFAQQTSELRDTLHAAMKEDVRPVRTTGAILVRAPEIRAMVSPTGEGDYYKYIQMLPGVATGADGSSALYVRGGNLGSNIVTIDGVPVYAGSHLLGLMSVFSNDVVSETVFRVGGFASDEGNLTSSHVLLRSTPADMSFFRASASISNFMAGASIKVPVIKERVGLVAAGRWSPAGWEAKLLEGRLKGIRDVDASIHDLYGKIQVRLWKGSSLEGSYFQSGDEYLFSFHDNLNERMGWQNQIALSRWEWNFWKIRFSASAYADLKTSDQRQVKTAMGVENTFMIRDSLREKGLDGVMAILHGGWTLSGGYSRRWAGFNPGSSTSYAGNELSAGREIPIVDNRMDAETETWHAQAAYERMNQLSVRAAWRYNMHGFFKNHEYSAYLRWSPIFWLGFELTYDDRVQYYHTLEGIPVGWALDMVVPSDERHPPETMRQYYAGLFGERSNHAFRMGGYWKKMDNLVHFMDAGSLFRAALADWRSSVCVGDGLSYGLEATYRYSGSRFSAHGAYTLSKTDRYFARLNEGKRFPAKFDRRHILNLYGKYVLRKNLNHETGVTTFLTLQSGCWETVPAGKYGIPLLDKDRVWIDIYGTTNNYQMPMFFRWDAGWYTKWQGLRFLQELNLGIYNLTNRHNPFMITYDAEEREWKRIPLLPIMPSISYRLSF